MKTTIANFPVAGGLDTREPQEAANGNVVDWKGWPCPTGVGIDAYSESSIQNRTTRSVTEIVNL